MATSITTINSTDLITNSRADINNNFDSILVNKMETSVLSTDSTFAAASDSKIPSELAVKRYVDAGGNVNASETQKGIVEEATVAEVIAGTATGGTGARLFVNPSVLPVALTVIPRPLFAPGDNSNDPTKTVAITTNTTARLTLVNVPHRIVVNKVSFYASTNTTPGTVDISLYSEDGQTQLFSVTTASISGVGVVTTSVSSVAVAPGNYFIMINPNSTTNFVGLGWYATDSSFEAARLTGGVTGEPVLNGILTITADTPPTTFTPSSITANATGCVAVRFDN